MAEWSKAPDLGSGLFGGVGSNPTLVIYFANEWEKSVGGKGKSFWNK